MDATRFNQSGRPESGDEEGVLRAGLRAHRPVLRHVERERSLEASAHVPIADFAGDEGVCRVEFAAHLGDALQEVGAGLSIVPADTDDNPAQFAPDGGREALGVAIVAVAQ